MNLAKFSIDFGIEWRKRGFGKKLTRKLFPKIMARRDEKRANESGQALPVDTEEVSMLQGKKTYLGILVAGLGLVLGWVGVGSEEATALSGQLVAALDQILTVGGLLFAAYGRAKAKPAA